MHKSKVCFWISYKSKGLFTLSVSVRASVDANKGYHYFLLFYSDWVTLAMTLENQSQTHSQASMLIVPFLYYISWISRIRWIQPQSVKHDWRLLKAYLCLTVGSLVWWLWLLTGNQQLVISNTGFLPFWRTPSLISLILNTKSEKNTIVNIAADVLCEHGLRISN